MDKRDNTPFFAICIKTTENDRLLNLNQIYEILEVRVYKDEEYFVLNCDGDKISKFSWKFKKVENNKAAKVLYGKK